MLRAGDGIRRIGRTTFSYGDGAAEKVAPNVPGDAPRGEYGAGNEGARRNRGSSALSQIGVREGGELPIDRLRRRFGEIISGAKLEVDDELRTLQAIALNTLQSTFTNRYHDDQPLKHAVGEKQPHFSRHERGADFETAFFKHHSLAEKQRDALCLVLRTFNDPTNDVELRCAVFTKLGQMGTHEDLDAVMPHVRKATSPRDLFFGLGCIKEMTKRLGSPVKRTNLHHDPVIGPLLAKDRLSAAERQQVIEEVLKRGEIRKVRPFDSKGEYHGSEVCVVEFTETLPGEKSTIKAAFKPEAQYWDKKEAYFSREVLMYEFDREFTKTGLINPTVEAFVKVHGSHHELGSMSYWEPRAKPYARRPPGRAHEAMVPPNDPLPEHRHLAGEPWFQRRMDQLRTLLYIFNNDDLLANNVNPRDNLANILVVVDQQGVWDMRVVDWAAAAGGNRNSNVYIELDEGILPRRGDPELMRRIAQAPKDALRETAEEFVKPGDAERLARRTVKAFNILNKRAD